ncbi:MAG: hypothetical protein AAF788_04325 [Pseudomonadota bacterium]
MQRRVVRKRGNATKSYIVLMLLLLAAGAFIGTGIKMLRGDGCYQTTREVRDSFGNVSRQISSQRCF